MTNTVPGGKKTTTGSESCGTFVGASASVRLDRDQTQYSALAVVLLGVDDDDLRERAEAELAQLKAERDEWRANFEKFYALVNRHHDGTGAALVKYAVKVETRKDTE